MFHCFNRLAREGRAIYIEDASNWEFVARKVYFCCMAHDHHHSEPEQNEIAGPVVLAVILLAIVVTAIGFMAS
jgi:hypothetical protein